MKTKEKTLIPVNTVVNAPVEKVWEFWTNPRHIVEWNNASDNWHTTVAENDLQPRGRFKFRMEARDRSSGFDFTGEYIKVEQNKLIAYRLDDGRQVRILFMPETGKTRINEFFEAEREYSHAAQKYGWQSILNNFKEYVERGESTETLHFEITITAKAEKVYKTMLDKKGFIEWTSVFNPDSRYDGSWRKGSLIRFIGTNSEGKRGGMISRIRENIPDRYVSIEHLGIIRDDKEITSGPDVENLAGARENYTFSSMYDKTLLSVDVDSNEDFRRFFMDRWPKALEKLKKICEGEGS